ncbi:MAG: phosphoenolpyruvate carboxykinase [Nitrospirae bacterium GWF2_44_13]|nr:MAG: phosphoenolpyruvate carboxykinase [Nitrospirae bacterium GWF2_44_13]OGW35837.1 MAG: phosphoenolpyruvate carboxykinase [Nitrospirae bacterium GWD2_44_7]OGW63889.1 MAG: phosphoenolpyruvate carboxykinase [Nitrospirae bacterium RIFOXYA2_FULL_44_9]HBG93123.1 phosphoenolpyruvate carboxykinase (GTP) [Nitrospiraceae bacterium]
MPALTKNEKLNNWIKETAEMCRPDDIYLCNGTKEEYNLMIEKLKASGSAIPLKKRPNSYLFRSDPSDVARIEDHTFISTSSKDEAGPTNNWIDPVELKNTMKNLYKGCMKGRTMYVIPFSMGPVGSPISKIGVEITDSPYVVISMHVMTRVSSRVIELLNAGEDFIPCLHSIGAPLDKGQTDVQWPCAPIEKKYISHFPEENLIWSYGSGYGGNALLGKKCLGLRIASAIARREGWMAEHMVILRLTNPEGKQYHIAAAFPSACGKTNLAMMLPSVKGWKCECIGDDIAWMKIGADGRLYAINPESGFFGVATGTSYDTNPMAMDTLKENVIFTNCALTDDGDVWWEGINDDVPSHLIDWKGQDWTPESKGDAAHPNARFTAPASQCPVICKDWENPNGVPIDIFIFGGRRSSVVPLVYEAFSWDHGVFLGATAASETTFANIGEVGSLRRDPFAMKPFCSYNMGDYFQHWLNMGDRLGSKAPRIFYVNWFRKNHDGRFLWPGFSDNSRALKWMCERIDGKVGAKKSAIGLLPVDRGLDLNGIGLSPKNMEELMEVDLKEWKAEIPDIEKHFAVFGNRLPERLKKQLKELAERLG